MQLTRRMLLRAGVGAALARGLALAQDPSQDQPPTFVTGVKVVNVFATVRAKNGEIVRSLTQDDFSLTENGRPQKIQYFARDTGLPLTLGLMVDTSMSQEKVLAAERGASGQFLDQVLREDKDKVFIMQFDIAVLMRRPLTSSRRELIDALAYVDTPTRKELQLQNGGGTLLYDAIVKASKDVMSAQQNRKALILLTDGVDTGSEATLGDAIDAAQRADTLVFAILFSDEGYYTLPFGFGGGGDGKGVLERLAKETGGSFFEVSKKQPIERIYDDIQDELRSQYSLGFVSDQPVRVSEWRSLKLTVKRKGLTVESRDRYWARR